jgi:hypothetical protein
MKNLVTKTTFPSKGSDSVQFIPAAKGISYHAVVTRFSIERAITPAFDI